MRTARQVALDSLGQEGFFKGDRTGQIVDAISAGLSAADFVVMQREGIQALVEAIEKALYAIDNILTAHEGQSEHAELMAAFKALEAALSKHFEDRNA